MSLSLARHFGISLDISFLAKKKTFVVVRREFTPSADITLRESIGKIGGERVSMAGKMESLKEVSTELDRSNLTMRLVES